MVREAHAFGEIDLSEIRETGYLSVSVKEDGPCRYWNASGW